MIDDSLVVLSFYPNINANTDRYIIILWDKASSLKSIAKSSFVCLLAVHCRRDCRADFVDRPMNRVNV
jgi:hypothetical protein